MIELLIGLIPFIPAFTSFLTPLVYLASRNRYIAMATGIAGLTITTILSLLVSIEAYSLDTPLVFKAGGWSAPIGITYIVDRFSALLGLVTSFILLLIMIYSVSYIVDDGYPWYTILLLGNASGLLGVIYTGDLFNLFVMLEVTSVSSYGLVMYYRHRGDSIVSGLKYAFIGSLGTALYLLSMGLVYSYYGTLNIVDFSMRIPIVTSETHYIVFGLIMGISLWTFSIKSGVFPNHFWLPDAHPAAPSPISALLSGLVVNTGIVGLYKFLYIATWSAISDPLYSVKETVSLIAVVMGALSALVGGLLMMIQTDVKRLIAYSTVMNLGYLFMGIACISELGLLASTYYIIMHSLAKATLFLSTGVFIKIAGSRNINELSGLGSRYIIPGLAFTVSTLTLAGIPPLPGFLAKLLLYNALFEYNPVAAILMIIASSIGLLSYMRLFYIVVLGTPITTKKKIDFKAGMFALAVLSLVIIAVGIVFLLGPEYLELVFGSCASQTINIEEYIINVANKLYLK